MDHLRYAAFLPSGSRSPVEPVSTWWTWRGRRVHIVRARRPQAPMRLMVLHGAGGYSGALWPAAAHAAGGDVELLAPDLPLYGDTVEPDPAAVRYPDWVELVCELIRRETDADDRPLALFGASMGGLLAYEAAARTRRVAHVAATCLLDPTDPAARRAAARMSWTGAAAPAVLRAVDPVAGRLRMPVRWLVNMPAMSNDPALSRLCASDPKGGGVRIPLGFVASWMNFEHTSPEEFDAAPVTLTHPAVDRWTPAELSIRFLQRIPHRTELVLLENCGHFPIEQPGLDQLAATLRAIRDRVAGRPAS